MIRCKQPKRVKEDRKKKELEKENKPPKKGWKLFNK